MDIFGIVIGQNVLTLFFVTLVAFMSYGLLGWGWLGKIAGIFLFGGSIGWIVYMLLHRGSYWLDNGLYIPFLTALLATTVAVFVAYANRDAKRGSIKDKTSSFNRNSIIGGLLVVVVLLTLVSYISQGNWENLYTLNDPVAQRASESAQDGIRGFINTLLREFDKELAR